MNTAKKSSGGGPLDPPSNTTLLHPTHKFRKNQTQNIPTTKYTKLHASSLQNVMQNKSQFLPPST